MMWFFAILGSLGLVFMLYAFVQFFREANGELATVSTVPTRKPGPGRLDARSGWIQLRSSERTLLSKDTQPNGVMVMGKFRSAVSAVMVMWSCAAYAQAQDAPPVIPAGISMIWRKYEGTLRHHEWSMVSAWREPLSPPFREFSII